MMWCFFCFLLLLLLVLYGGTWCIICKLRWKPKVYPLFPWRGCHDVVEAFLRSIWDTHTHTLTSELVALCQLHGLFFFVLFYLFIFLVIVCLSYQSMIVEVSLWMDIKILPDNVLGAYGCRDWGLICGSRHLLNYTCVHHACIDTR